MSSTASSPSPATAASGVAAAGGPPDDGGRPARRMLAAGRIFAALARRGGGAAGDPAGPWAPALLRKPEAAPAAVPDPASTPPAQVPAAPADALALSRRRVSAFLTLAAVVMVAILARLVYLQIVEADRYRAMRDRQDEGVMSRRRPRWPILSADRVVLAEEIRLDSVYVDPAGIENPWTAAVQLGTALRRPPADLLPFLQPRDAAAPDRARRFVPVQRRVSAATAERVRALRIPGVGLVEEPVRQYPLGSLGAALIGGVGVDGQGLGGMELAMDPLLRGARESERVRRDARRVAIAVESELPRLNLEGRGLVLTMDSRIQRIVEEEVDAVEVRHRPAWICAVALQPFTGEVLAATNRPAFDPNAFGRAAPDARRFRCATDPYEPGSTMKPFILGACLEEGLTRIEDVVDCENGSWTVGGRRITDHHPYGRLTVRDVIAKSSNVGAVKLGLLLEEKRGAETIRRYLKAYGFGAETGLDIPGESPGRVVPPARWSRYTTTSVPIGYEIGVTALQMARAYAVFANGGYLVEPRIVRGVADAGGRLVWTPPAEPPRRILRSETVDKVRQALQAAVEAGTAKPARLEGYAVAGKTGTAQRYNPATRRYDGGYIASFAGFAPSDEARLCVLVVVGEPRGGDYYGGKVAAPAVGRILERSLQLLEVPPRSGASPVAAAR